jgi:hypothetical protein
MVISCHITQPGAGPSPPARPRDFGVVDCFCAESPSTEITVSTLVSSRSGRRACTRFLNREVTRSTQTPLQFRLTTDETSLFNETCTSSAGTCCRSLDGRSRLLARLREHGQRCRRKRASFDGECSHHRRDRGSVCFHAFSRLLCEARRKVCFKTRSQVGNVREYSEARDRHRAGQRYCCRGIGPLLIAHDGLSAGSQRHSRPFQAETRSVEHRFTVRERDAFSFKRHRAVNCFRASAAIAQSRSHLSALLRLPNLEII